jgi:hypothetical protein
MGSKDRKQVKIRGWANRASRKKGAKTEKEKKMPKITQLRTTMCICRIKSITATCPKVVCFS